MVCCELTSSVTRDNRLTSHSSDCFFSLDLAIFLQPLPPEEDISPSRTFGVIPPLAWLARDLFSASRRMLRGMLFCLLPRLDLALHVNSVRDARVESLRFLFFFARACEYRRYRDATRSHSAPFSCSQIYFFAVHCSTMGAWS